MNEKRIAKRSLRKSLRILLCSDSSAKFAPRPPTQSIIHMEPIACYILRKDVLLDTHISIMWNVIPKMQNTRA